MHNVSLELKGEVAHQLPELINPAACLLLRM
jgi:hypothetical protein